MKKTSNELLQFFGVKIGDKIKVDGYTAYFAVFTEDNEIRIEEVYEDHVNIWNIPSFVSTLIENNYEIVKPKKKLGKMKCREINCCECPLRAIDCDITSSRTLYEVLEKYKKYLNNFNFPLKPFEKTFIDAIKVELDKDV